MKALARRLHRLEEDSIPQVDWATQRAADLLRERRQRRLEAAGVPFADLQRPEPRPGARSMSVAETLRAIRQTRVKATVEGVSR